MSDGRSLRRPIVAMGGGGCLAADDPRQLTALDRLVLDLARARRGRERPRIAFVGTASGDAPEGAARFLAAFGDHAETVTLTLFERTVEDLGAFVLDLDGVYVGGGNTASLLAVWRAHGLDGVLHRAHGAGIVLAGMSAGAICWFESGTTDSYGPTLVAVHGGLGLVPGSHSPHYDGEPQRRPTYQRLIAAGELPDGLAADDGAALVFDGPTLVEAVAERPGARAYRVVRAAGGGAIEDPLPTRWLP